MIYKSTKVLLVEDMPVIARVTEQMLKKGMINRYTSTLVMRMSETLAALAREDFDIILLDLNLPDSRDLDTVARVVEQAPETPIIVLTATNDEDMGRRAVQMGAQDFLLKGDFNYMTLDRAMMFAIERHRLQRTLRQLAVLDDLTGLYNRRGFNALNSDFLQKAAESNARGYLCFFDLDSFKQINDVLGHAAGDDALKDFAQNLQSVFRKDTLLVRLGGDEFVAMGMEHAPGQLQETLATLQIVLTVRNAKDLEKPALETSCGYVFFDGSDSKDITRLSAEADAALYRDKQERKRNRPVAFMMALRGERA
jgi:two-component system, cell cycle response regulator